MSLESARLFVQKMYTNMEFSSQVLKIEDKREFYDFVAKEGYDFEAEELKKADQEFRQNAGGELSDEELSMVVGGCTTMVSPCTSNNKAAYCL